MWGRMNMNPTDILDVSGATYTYLINGQPPAANWTALFSPRERVRLRFINGSSMSIFDVRIPGLPMTVVQTDGNDVEPVAVDEFRISVAETYDVIVQPEDASAYTIFAQSKDRSGYARGTLSPRSGLAAPVPALDPRPLLSMLDMGMAAPMKATPDMDMTGMSDMPGMTAPSGKSAAAAERGLERAEVDMVVAHPRIGLDDPGVGLRANGRRVLSYGELHTLGGPLDAREPSREIELHLTGHMQRHPVVSMAVNSPKRHHCRCATASGCASY